MLCIHLLNKVMAKNIDYVAMLMPISYGNFDRPKIQSEYRSF